MAKENKSETTKPQKCHTVICEPGSNKDTMWRSRVQAARATFSQILELDPKASNDHVGHPRE